MLGNLAANNLADELGLTDAGARGHSKLGRAQGVSLLSCYLCVFLVDSHLPAVQAPAPAAVTYATVLRRRGDDGRVGRTVGAKARAPLDQSCPPRAALKAPQRLGQRLDEGPNLVAHASVVGERLFFGLRAAGETRRVIEANVYDLRLHREYRACLVRLVAHGHHVVELCAAQVADVLGAVAGDIDARLGHDADRPRVQAARLNAGRAGLDGIPLQMPHPALGHLAPAGVAGAEEEYLQLCGHPFAPAWRGRPYPAARQRSGHARATAARACRPKFNALIHKNADRGAGVSHALVRSRGVEPANVTTIPANDLQNQPETGGAECGALSADSGPAAPAAAPVDLPPDVADLARRLAALPEAVRASLLAGVKAADTKD